MRLSITCLFIIIASATFAQAPSISFQNRFGGSDLDKGGNILEMNNGDFIFAGFTSSSNGTILNHGSSDIWLMRLSNAGHIIWQKCLGGSLRDEIGSNDILKATNDGGFIIGATTYSNDGDVIGGPDSSSDCWVIKVDADGTILWQKTFGGSGKESINSISQTDDGGYIFVGTTNSPDGDVSGLHVSGPWGDAWIVKLDNSGNIIWQKTIGGSQQEFGNVVFQTTDGNYLVEGSTGSNDGDIIGQHNTSGGSHDVFLAKISAINGSIIWTKCIGGTGNEQFGTIIGNADGTFMLGVTNGSLDGDFLGLPRNQDYCLLKLNGTGNILWKKNYGGSSPDLISSVVKAAEGGYLLAGSSYSDDGDKPVNYSPFNSSDLWFVKVSDSGALQWQKTLGGSGNDFGPFVHQCSDTGYIVNAFTLSDNHDVTMPSNGYFDIWIFKLDGFPTGIQPMETIPTAKVFPNPTNGSVFITAEENLTNSKLRLTNSLGQTLNCSVRHFGHNNIEVAGIPQGIHFLTLQMGHRSQTFRIVVSD